MVSQVCAAERLVLRPVLPCEQLMSASGNSNGLLHGLWVRKFTFHCYEEL